MMLESGAAIQVETSEQLASGVIGWLGDASVRAEAGERGRQLVAENRGALNRLFALIEKQLPPTA